MVADPNLLALQLQLIGQRQVVLGLKEVTTELRSMQRQTDVSTRSTHAASREGFLWAQTMFTLRRGLYYLTSGLLAATIGISTFGLRFDANMESNQIAFTRFTGSAANAHKELNYLYQLAATTPFEFADVTDAARKFMAFGFTVQETNTDLLALGDAAASFGTGAEGIQHMVIAIGQMRATGRVMGQDLLQLTQQGIPATQILQKQLGLTANQIAHLGDLGLRSDIAIPALIRGMQQLYGGASKAQALTFNGLTSTLHDYAAQLSGAVTAPLFDLIKKHLPGINKSVQIITQTMQKQGFNAMVQALDDQTHAGGRVVNIWNQMKATAFALWNILSKAVIPAFLFFRGASFIFSPLLSVLTLLGRHTTLLRFVLIPLVAVLLTWESIQLANIAAGKVLTTVTKLQKITTLEYWRAQKLVILSTKMWTGAQWLLNLAMDANPVFLIITGIALLGGAIYILWTKVGIFRDGVRAVWDWIVGHWPLLLAIMTGPIGVAVYMIVKHFGTIKDAFREVINWIIQGWNRLHFHIGSFKMFGHRFGGVDIGLPHIPLLALGGLISTPGSVIVGDQGPEILSLPRGAGVSPLPYRPQFGSSPAYQNIPNAGTDMLRNKVLSINVPVSIDGRQVGEAVAQVTLDAIARA